MGTTLFRAILLIGLGVIAGFAHAQWNKKGDRPLMFGLPPQDATAVEKPPVATAQTPGVESKPVAPAPAAVTPSQPVPQPAATPSVEKPVEAPAVAATPDDGYFISIAKAKEMFDGKKSGAWDGIFIDARPYHEYTAGHIPGSMHIDKKYFDGAVPKKIRDYLPGMPVVIYCHGENCTDSEAVATRLLALKRGIGPIHIIKDGYPGWTGAGYPVETGPEVGFD